MAQTSYYAKLERPEMDGAKLVNQFGWAKFTKKGLTLPIATKLLTVKSFGHTWRTGAPGGGAAGKSSGLVLGTTLTVKSGYIHVTRSTLGGSASGATIWYELIGW